MAARGFRLTLIAQHPNNESINSVQIIAIPSPKNRWWRWFKTVPSILIKAVKLQADVYHFHDPELIPVGLILWLCGHKVVYDMHEDYVSSIAQKTYIQPALRRSLSVCWNYLEIWATRAFTVVIAERYYSSRFPNATPVLNYPVLQGTSTSAHQAGSTQALYTGNVTEDRGALNLARILSKNDKFSVHVIGRCTPTLAAKMRQEAKNGSDRLFITGEGRYIPFAEINAVYSERRWLAGLAIFPPTQHYLEKELTKFFEYMQAGLPVVCSNFPAWKTLIADQGFGLCVDPTDADAVIDALRWLNDHPAEAGEMGRRGQAAVKARYNWEKEASRLAALYLEICQ